MLKRDKYADAVPHYEAGESIEQVAARYGVTRQSMHSILKRRGCVFRGRLDNNPFYRGGSRAVDASQNLVERAIERGDLVRPSTCERCQSNPPAMKDGRSRIQAHHDDYDKPLEVRWLCQECHFAVHREIYLKREVSNKEAMPTLVSAGFP